MVAAADVNHTLEVRSMPTLKLEAAHLELLDEHDELMLGCEPCHETVRNVDVATQ